MFHMYVLLVGVAIGVLMSFQPNVIAAIQSCGLQLMHGLLYVYYAVYYAVWLLLFLNTKRGLLLTVEVL